MGDGRRLQRRRPWSLLLFNFFIFSASLALCSSSTCLSPNHCLHSTSFPPSLPFSLVRITSHGPLAYTGGNSPLDARLTAGHRAVHHLPSRRIVLQSPYSPILSLRVRVGVLKIHHCSRNTRSCYCLVPVDPAFHLRLCSWRFTSDKFLKDLLSVIDRRDCCQGTMSEASLLYRLIFRFPTSVASMRFTEYVRLCVRHDAPTLRSVSGFTALAHSSAVVAPRLPVFCSRRRILPCRDAVVDFSTPLYLIDGHGIPSQNPSISLVALMGCFGLYCIIGEWFLDLELNPSLILMTLLGCFGLYGFIWDWVLAIILISSTMVVTFLGCIGLYLVIFGWALEVYLGMVISLGVELVNVISRLYSVQSHLVLIVLDLVFILTSLSTFHSSIRESPISTPLFKRANFSGRVIPDQRPYSLLEKIQTACKRTFVEILKAVLLWSTFGECAITCINHLDPIEEPISMRFEDLSLCFSLCIFKWLTFLLSILWFEDATKMYRGYVTDFI